jgi:glucokinase
MNIVFDIGGSKMRIASSLDGKTLSEPIIHDTPEQYKEGLQLLIKSIKSLSKKNTVATICGCISGVIDRKTGTLLHSPNLRGWEGHSLGKDLSKFAPEVFIENDAAFAGLAEAIHGAGKGYEIVAYMTVSTGVGGARIVQEMIDIRRVGFEPGQQIIDKETLTSVENLVSGKALQKKYGKSPRDITDPVVWKKAAEKLAIGLHNTILHWSPDVVVLGGPMILGTPSIDIGYVEEYLKTIMIMFPELPIITKAKLDDSRGLIGALEYIKQMSGEIELLY